MAVAFDAQSVSLAFAGTSPTTWTHTPVGTPRGASVAIDMVVDAGTVSAVTYGGVAMTVVENQVSGGGESGRATIWFLGASIPTGAQTVSITHNGSGNNGRGTCVTVTAATDTEVGDSDFDIGNQQNASVSLTTAAVALRHGVIYTAEDNSTEVVALSGMTQITQFSSGFRSTAHHRQTTPSSGAFTFGYTTANVTDLALVALAIQEVAPTVPTAPSNLVATTISTTQIDLAWDDNSSDETSFRVERSPNGTTGWVTAGTPAANAETFSDTGRTCGTAYFYRVFAVNAAGDSTASNTDSDTTDACPPAPPSTGGNRMGGTGAIRRPPRTVRN